MRHPVFQHNATAQTLNLGCRGNAFELNEVLFMRLVFGICNTMLQFSIIGEQQQPLTVQVKAPGGINAGYIYEICKGLTWLTFIAPV